MANSSAVAKYNRNMRTFEYNINKILNGIDRRSKSRKSEESDEDVMSTHQTDINENGERTWSF